ncbi:hypothetical protein CDAR_405471 [Caerostris darwini]|uniref:Uncharacterized protein n=1 Tax=Caerostris darwini TaxID=1538125 RepID=A0AAV4WH40_9ARAC|nr:hypothetical protein CDAR_405471 [Caerostris darwini]
MSEGIQLRVPEKKFRMEQARPRQMLPLDCCFGQLGSLETFKVAGSPLIFKGNLRLGQDGRLSSESLRIFITPCVNS